MLCTPLSTRSSGFAQALHNSIDSVIVSGVDRLADFSETFGTWGEMFEG